MKPVNMHTFISFFFYCLVSFGRESIISKDGDYIIEFILSVHDGEWMDNKKALSMYNVLAVEAIISTMKDINNDPELLPNITLGYIIRDDYGSKRRATELTMSLMSRIIKNTYRRGIRYPENSMCNHTCSQDHAIDQRGQFGKPVVAVVGGTTSDIGMRIATVLRPIEIPVISYMTTSNRLRRVKSFPFLVNLLPSDKYQAKAIMDLTDEFQWSYVLVLVSTSSYGIEGLAMLEKEASKRTTCLHSRTILIPTGDTSNNTSIRKAVEQIKKDKRLTVVIVFMYVDDVKRLFQEVERQNVTGITWIASEAWAEKDAILNFPPHVVRGTLGVKLVSKFSELNKRMCRRPNIKDNVWMVPFLCQYHNVSQLNCSRTWLRNFLINYQCFHNIFPPSVADVWSFAENVIVTLAQALDDLLTGSTNKTFDYGALFDSIRSMRLRDSSDRNYIGPSVINYTVVNLQSVEDAAGGRLKFVHVGNWTKDLSNVGKKRRMLFLNKSSIQWNTGRVPQSRCSEPCAGGYKTMQGPHRCCWHCEACPPDHITNSTDPHRCTICPETEHPDENRNQCEADSLIFFHYKHPIGIVILATCSLGEIVGVALFATLRHWNNHRQYRAMPYQTLSFVITVVGFLQPLMYLQRTTRSVCHFRCIAFVVFLNIHASFLLCSCGKVRRLVVRMHTTLACISRRRQQKTVVIRKPWTRSMRVKFAKRTSKTGEVYGISNAGIDGENITEKSEAAERRKAKSDKPCDGRLQLQTAGQVSAREKPGSEEEVKIKSGDKDEENSNAGVKRSCHLTPTFTHHVLFFTAFVLSCLPLVFIRRDSLFSVTYVKMDDVSGYLFCSFGRSKFIWMFPVLHLLPLVLTLVLTNQTKTTTAERNRSKSSVDVSLFYVHDRLVYYLSYLILLIECTFFPFSFILPGPMAKDVLIFALILFVQYSFVLTTYGTKIYVICREKYKNK